MTDRTGPDRSAEPTACLILCLGNDLRADDGVGWRVADRLEHRRLPWGVEVRRSAVSGFYLLDELQEAERVVVVDAIHTGCHEPGTVLSLPLSAISSARGPSPHGVGLRSVLEEAARFGIEVPRAVHVIAVEVEDMVTIGVGLTRTVEDAVGPATEAVLEAVERFRDRAPEPTPALVGPSAPRTDSR